MPRAELAPRVALLRGVNLGGRRMEMGKLQELLVEHGHVDVATYVRSGNVALRSAVAPRELEELLAEQISAGFGFAVDVVVRTLGDLERVVAHDPLRAVAVDPSRYVVTFLKRPLEPTVVDALAALDLAPELVAVGERELYSWHPNGQARSELGKHLGERALGVSATARNWNTVLRLLALARGLSGGG